jgi:hypothetical protein
MSKVSVRSSPVVGSRLLNSVCGATSGELLIKSDASGIGNEGRVIINVSFRGSKVMMVEFVKSMCESAEFLDNGNEGLACHLYGRCKHRHWRRSLRA